MYCKYHAKKLGLDGVKINKKLTEFIALDLAKKKSRLKNFEGILNPVIGVLDLLGTKISGLSATIGILKTSVSGIGIFAGGLLAVHDSISSITKDGADFVNVMEGLAGTVASVGGATLTLTTLLGPVGTVLGVIVGLMGSLAVATNTLMEDSDSLSNRIKNVNTTLSEYRDVMQEADESRRFI